METQRLVRERHDEQRYGLEEIWHDQENLRRVRVVGRIGYQIAQAWRGMRTSLLTSAATVATIAVSLFVVGAFATALQSFQAVVQQTRQDLGVSVYARAGVSEEEMLKLQEQLKARPEIADVSYVSPADALKEFRGSLGEEAELLDGLEVDNPLPASLEIVLHKTDAQEGEVGKFAAELRADERIEFVEYSRGLYQQLGVILSRLRMSGLVVTLFVLLIMGFIISNTIQLALYGRRAEIEIMKLVGATHGFIQAPFLIEGAVQGFAGSLFALLILAIIQQGLGSLIDDVAFLNLLGFQLQSIGPVWSFLLVVVGVCVGIGGSYVAVRRFSDS